MKIALLCVPALTGVVLAQDLSGQPACAVSPRMATELEGYMHITLLLQTDDYNTQTSCIISAVSAVGCAPADISCQCGPSKAAIGASAAPCLLQNCPLSALGQAQSAGEAKCKSYSASHTTRNSATTTHAGSALKDGNEKNHASEVPQRG